MSERSAPNRLGGLIGSQPRGPRSPWPALPVLLLLALLSACGSGRGGALDLSASSTAGTASVPQQRTAPTPPPDAPGSKELEALLRQEFERLGIDPNKVAAKAPEGDDNAVFDLRAAFFDTKKGIVLSWTERMVGDYDMNGEV